MEILVGNCKFFSPRYLMPTLRAFSLEFYNGNGAQKTRMMADIRELWWCVHWRYVHLFRLHVNISIVWTDGRIWHKSIRLCMHSMLTCDKKVADRFCFCHWRHNNSKFIFISIFMLLSHDTVSRHLVPFQRAPVMFASILMGFLWNLVLLSTPSALLLMSFFVLSVLNL